MKTKPKNENVVNLSGMEREYRQSLSLDIIGTMPPKVCDDLFRAAYFLNRYAKRRKKLVIKRGEDPDTTKNLHQTIIRRPV